MPKLLNYSGMKARILMNPTDHIGSRTPVPTHPIGSEHLIERQIGTSYFVLKGCRTAFHRDDLKIYRY